MGRQKADKGGVWGRLIDYPIESMQTKTSLFFRPSVPCQISGPLDSDSVVMPFIVDSGADIPIMPREVLEALGYDFSNKGLQSGKGVGGGFKHFLLEDFKIGFLARTGTYGFMVEGPVAVLENYEFSSLLLGRNPFFAMFKITFQYANPQGPRIVFRPERDPVVKFEKFNEV